MEYHTESYTQKVLEKHNLPDNIIGTHFTHKKKKHRIMLVLMSGTHNIICMREDDREFCFTTKSIKTILGL